MATRAAGTPPRDTRLTARGAATRERIVAAAADLMYAGGAGATTLDDVRAAAGVSKSQLYRHFADKDALVQAVIALRGQQVLERETRRLGRLSSLDGLARWRDAVVAASARQGGAHGCVLGSMASELADSDEQARARVAGLLRQWEALLAAGLGRMRDAGILRPDADPGRLAVGLMAALQGGYLLADTARDARRLEIALDLALEGIQAYARPA
ncbi:MAG TPA: TetR family transcriptional regulator [Trebonia sp.]|jgi:AcrR family transcriptional regulator|nr:TetR family transcriptional regulator [Trebonia sp.]